VFEDRGIDKWGRRTRDERGGEGRGADGLLQGLGGHGDMGWLQGASGRQDLPDGPTPAWRHHPQRGTVLGTERSAEFATPEGQRQAAGKLAEAGVEGLVVIGGNGSLTGD
jgi:6-phosphofructokinase